MLHDAEVVNLHAPTRSTTPVHRLFDRVPTRPFHAATAAVRLLLAIALLPLAAQAQRGVPQDGYPSWHERVLQVLVNRVRADPDGEVKACSSTARAPLAWEYNLNRTARFHSGNLARTGKFQHDSPCTLVPTIANLFPPLGSCDGSAACACVGGTVTCNPTCTTWSGRMTLFGSPGGGRAENVAYGYTTPRSVHTAWMGSSGHCTNILGSYAVLGAGRDGTHWTQNFSSSGNVTGTLIAGGHEPQSVGTSSTNVEFRTNYYDTNGGPLSGAVNIDGTCTPMTLERGSATNATHLATVPLAGTACRRYAFVFTDPLGATVRLPETGSYGVGGAGCADWTAQAPPECGVPATSTPTNTRTATPSMTPSATQSWTPSSTQSNTSTMTPTATPTPTRTATPLPTWTPTTTASQTPTRSPSQTPTASPTQPPTWTPTVSPTQTPIPTHTATATLAATHTPSVTPTITSTYTPSVSPSASASPTATATATATRTPVEACSCYGDADRNGFVNFADFGEVQRRFGTAADPETGSGDGDCNGFVNFADFGAVQTHFGQPCN